MAWLKKVEIGERLARFPGRTFNALVDAVEAQQKRPLGPPPPLPSQVTEQNVTVHVRNDSGAALDRAAIVKLGDPLETPDVDADVAAREPILSAESPAANEPFAVVPLPLADEGLGEAVRIGFAWVKVNVVASDHACATAIEDDSTKLTSAANGAAEIVWKEAGTGERWALVFVGLGQFRRLRGTAVANVAPTDPTFQLENLVTLEQLSARPGEPLTVANVPGLELTAGDLVYASYSPGITGGVDWEAEAQGGGGGGTMYVGGCGILIDVNEISFDPDTVSGGGVYTTGLRPLGITPCGLAIDTGCHVWVTPENKLTLNFVTLLGRGLQEYEPATGEEIICLPMELALGCHLNFDAQDRVEVNLSSLAGSGLTIEAAAGGCSKLAVTGGGGGASSDEIVDIKVPGPQTIQPCIYVGGKKRPTTFSAYLETRDGAGDYTPVGPPIACENHSPDQFAIGEYGAEGFAVRRLHNGVPFYTLLELFCQELSSGDQLPNP